MKIFHIADIHLGDFLGPSVGGENGRLVHIRKALDSIVDEAAVRQPEIVIIPGDIFHKSKVWGDTMLKLIKIFNKFLNELKRVSGAHIIVTFGTSNHDNYNAFDNLMNRHLEIDFITEPKIITANCEGFAQIACIPGLDKRVFREKMNGMDVVDENMAMSEMLGDIVKGLAAEMDEDAIKILATHYSVIGAKYDNDSHIFHNNEVLLRGADIDAGGFNLACLGHIHKPQKVEGIFTPTFYAGSIHKINFNEEYHDKGFYVHEFDGKSLTSEFIELPYIDMQTLRFDQEDIDNIINNDLNDVVKHLPKETTIIKDNIVRVLYECDSETEKRLSKKTMEEELYELGAFYVHEIRPEKITQTVNQEVLSENDSIIDNLKRYLEEKELQVSISIDDILTAAKPIIDEVEASISNTKSRGLFRPLNLEVKNYRKYKEESFDLTQIKFATVNGKNGIGKSSFFMDSIVDCLYEEPREGELTGWISSYVYARSGMIAFTFAIGDDTYKVIRTRTKSGKATLSLQKQIDQEQWEDISENKTADTQKKIIDVLGMDSRTFKVCVLIMQDNYGLFLEADKTERMKILSRILGLDVYEKLEKVFDELRLHNKRAALSTKESIENIDYKLLSYESVEEDIKKLKNDKLILEGKIEEYKEQVADTESAWNNSKLVRDSLKKSEERLQVTNTKLDGKVVEHTRIVGDIATMGKTLNRKDEIQANATEYEQYLEAKKVNESNALERTKINMEIEGIKKELLQLDSKINEKNNKIHNISTRLEKKEMLKAKAEGLEELKEQQVEYTRLRDKINRIDAERKDILHTKERETRNIDSKLEALKTKLGILNRKTELLGNSNCIDPLNAHCKFLEDAQKAKLEIPVIEKEIEELKNLNKEISKKYNLELEELEVKALENNNSINSISIDTVKKEIEEKQAAVFELMKLESDEKIILIESESLTELNNQKEKFITKKAEFGKVVFDLNSKIENFELMVLSSSLESDYNTLKKLPVLENQHKNQLKNKDRVEKEIEALRIENNAYAVEVDEYKTKLSETNFDSLKAKMLTVKERLQGLEDTKQSIILKLGAKQKDLETKLQLKEERKELLVQQEEKNRNREIYKILKVASSIDGVPFMIVRGVVDVLSVTVNEILAQMTAGKMSIEMKTEKVLKSNKNKEINALEVWINEYESGSLPYLSRSGGEKVRAALANTLGLAILNAKRAGIQIGMIFIDEPPFLDDEGVQAYCDALEAVRDKYPDMAILAISHDPSMKARFEQEIEVVETTEGSKVMLN